MNYVELSNTVLNNLSTEEMHLCNAYIKFINKKIAEQFEQPAFRQKLAEAMKLEIASELLHMELSNFIKSGEIEGVYKAKIGQTDDLVSALLLIIRMTDIVSKFDLVTQDYVRDFIDEDKRPPLGYITVNTRY